MPKFAVVSGNQVLNVIVAEDKKATEEALGVTLLEATDSCGPGWGYDPETGEFIEPPIMPLDE